MTSSPLVGHAGPDALGTGMGVPRSPEQPWSPLPRWRLGKHRRLQLASDYSMIPPTVRHARPVTAQRPLADAPKGLYLMAIVTHYGVPAFPQPAFS